MDDKKLGAKANMLLYKLSKKTKGHTRKSL